MYVYMYIYIERAIEGHIGPMLGYSAQALLDDVGPLKIHIGAMLGYPSEGYVGPLD